MHAKPRYPGTRVTVNGNQLVSYHAEARVADAGVFYPIMPSTEGGELFQQSFGEGRLNVGGAIAHSVCGRRVVNFTSGQGIVYGVEQYYHAPGKCRGFARAARRGFAPRVTSPVLCFFVQ